MAQGPYLRKYGASTTINFSLYEVDGVDLRVNAAHASGDTKFMNDEGVEANTASGFVDEGQGYSIALSATETNAARAVVYVVDQSSTKLWLDTSLIVETYGSSLAQHEFDLDAAATYVSTSDVQTASAAALTAYDPPTNTELNARTLVAASYVTTADLAARTLVSASYVTTADLAARTLAAASYPTTGDIPTAAANADALLNRDLSVGADTTTIRTPRQAMRFLRNKWSISTGTLTVYKENDTTVSWQSTVASSSAANPITGNDPG